MGCSPNIFRFATKELSQDAFLCWLLSWSNCDEDPNLKRCAQEFIFKHFNGNEDERNVDFKNDFPESRDINKIEIKKQFNGIDILVEIFLDNNEDKPKYFLIIEDKINSLQGENQIEKYFKKLKENNKNISKENISVAYFKTGILQEDEISQDVLEIIRPLIWNYSDDVYYEHYEDNFIDIYEFFEKFKSDSNPQIFNDYFDLLKRRHEAFEKAEKNLLENPTIQEIKNIFKESAILNWDMWFLEFISRDFRECLHNKGIKTNIKNHRGGNDRTIGIVTENWIPYTDLNLFWKEKKGEDDGNFFIVFKYLGCKKTKGMKKNNFEPHYEHLKIVQKNLKVGIKDKGLENNWKIIPISEKSNNRQNQIIKTEKEKVLSSSKDFDKFQEFLEKMKQLAVIAKDKSSDIRNELLGKCGDCEEKCF